MTSLIKELFINTNKLITTNFPVIVLLALFFLSSTTVGTWLKENSNLFSTQLNIFLYIVSFVLDFLIYYIFTKAILKSANKISLEKLQLDGREFLRYLIANILYFLLVTIGLIALIVPGVYFLTKYFFVSYLIIDKKLPIKEAFQESARLTDKKKLSILTLFLLVMVPMILISIILYGQMTSYLYNIFILPASVYMTIFFIEMYKKFR